MPLSFVPLAPAPPLLSGATNTVQPKTSSGGIDTVSSASSEALNGGRDSRRAQAAAMAGVAPSAQSPNGVSKGDDPAGPEGGGRDTPSPTLALARAGLRSVPKEHRREPRAVAAAAAEKAISMVGKSVERGGGSGVEADSSSGSGSGVHTDREDHAGGRSSPDSFYSDGSGDSSRGRGSTTRRTHSKVLELEERRAALVAASLRTSAVPPPPPPRLLSQASRDANGFLRGEVTRPKPNKLLARSKTTIVERTTSSSSSKLAGRSVAAVFFTNRPQGSGEDDPCEVIPLRPEMPRGVAPREYSPPPPGVKPTSSFGAGAATGGSVRSLVPGPRLVLAGPSFDADPKVSTAAPAVGGGGEKRHGGMLLVSRGSMDDFPPAEMGALGVSLVCTMCGRKERKRDAGVVKEVNGGVRDGRKGGKGVEMARCARCRKGCCQACLKHLPAHCRGPKIVIPVCGTCARGVDFENRWHHHLLATSRDRDRCNGVSHLPAAAGQREQGGGGRSRSVSPRADSACGSSPGQSPQRRSQAGADGKRGAGLRGSGRAEQKALGSTSSSLLRASSRLIRRSLSSSSMLGGAPPPPQAAAKTAQMAVDDSSVGAPPQQQQQPQLPPAGSRVFKVLSLPITRGGGGEGGNNGRPHSIPRCSSPHREESEEEDPAAEAATAAAPPIAASSAMAWFGSSIGSALSSLASSGGVGNGSTLASAFAPKDRSGGGGGATPPSARLTPASPASTSSSPDQDLEPPPQAIIPGSSTSATKPWATAGAPMALSVVTAAAAADGGSSGKARAMLPPGGGGRASPLDNGRFGRDPTECPCGAAALYREVMEVSGKGMAVAMVTAGGEAVGPEEAAAELEAKAQAAHKLVRAKAYAHLLTRAMKALAYADLQAKAFEFLRERGEAAKSEQAGLSPTADANPSRKDRSLPEAFLSVRDGDSSRLAATTGPTPTAAAATRGGNNGNDVRSLAVAAGENTLKVSSAGAGVGVGVRGVLQSVGSPTASSSSFSYPRVDSLPSVATGAGKAPETAPFSQMDLNEVAEVVVSSSSEMTNTMTTAAASESDSPRRRFSSDDGGVAVKRSGVAGGERGLRQEEEDQEVEDQEEERVAGANGARARSDGGKKDEAMGPNAEGETGTRQWRWRWFSFG
ncbi:hypothetical protein Esi_0929_0001 [Ectocarpus siliculosus]|uniref:Uncharacterized protein n=1 Tax=Ectocarpus siliculosus TaxID=2880 RepID=D7G8Y2_ECTSI|nr:hypothetical protein Esi_0929_0001 [Ectocarpus siliculosus]|eukprot:CBJ34066.1 hypothetical protein Esi_0929_0001 [Ectocarpus siliculosus]